MNDQFPLSRILWASRRGMLELDLALVPFVENVYETLSEEDQAIYRKLLECEDTDLFKWVLQKEVPEDEELASIMEKIITYAQTPKH